MVEAMDWNDQEPVLIEDLIKIGEDDGFEKGRQSTLRAGIAMVLEARGIALDDLLRARIEAELDADRLEAWMRRAVVVADARAVFVDGDGAKVP